MRRPLVYLLTLCAVVLPLAVSGQGRELAGAQGGADAWTLGDLNLRAGPSQTFDVIVLMPPNTALWVKARSPDHGWLLVHSEEGVFRGWVAADHVRLREGLGLDSLPLSVEVVYTLKAPASAAPALAGAGGWARFSLEVRTGPGDSFALLSMLPAMQGVVLEGRAWDGEMWLLVHTPLGGTRGWVRSDRLLLREDIDLSLLPALAETMPAPPPTPTPLPPPPTPTPAPVVVQAAAPVSGPSAPAAPSSSGRYNTAGIHQSFSYERVQSIDLNAYPVVPATLGQARAIFVRGRGLGRDPHVMAKVGDCASAVPHFLNEFGFGNYNLGNYGYLQGVIAHFGGSLAYNSLAASPGFVVGAVLDSTWADPSVCSPGESPLLCEYRLHGASVAVIMFGTQDVFLMPPEQFDWYLRQIVYESIQAGVIPVLSTFPGHLAHWDNTILYNQIVIRIALDFNVPLINLWAALQGLPNHGLGEDGNHLTNPPIHGGDLTEASLQAGFPVRNLVTLQGLDAVWRGAMY